MHSVDQVLVKSAAAGLRLQLKDGTMPAGCNGPHEHTMTPARTTSHWAITFARAYELTGDSEFRLAANLAYDALLSPKIRPLGGAFWHRKHPHRNSFNGLIGQAWTLEALIAGYHMLKRDDLLDLALAVFRQHKYDESHHLWYQLDLTGCPVSLEFTLNQQVWFASVGAALSSIDNNIAFLVEDFLSHLSRSIRLHKGGRFPLRVAAPAWVNWRKDAYLFLKGRSQLIREKEQSYHIFTLCGFSTIYRYFPNHAFWHNKNFIKALSYAFADDLLTHLRVSKFGFPYNVPGLELPYIVEIFGKLISQKNALDIAAAAYNQQLEDHWNESSSLLSENTPDRQTLSSRIYELYRITGEVKAFIEGHQARRI